MVDGNQVCCDDMGLPDPSASGVETEMEDLSLRSVREKAERRAVVAALARADGNIVKASEILGVSRPTLYDLLHRLAIKQ
jgi:two-component system NtrC family response regulator